MANSKMGFCYLVDELVDMTVKVSFYVKRVDNE